MAKIIKAKGICFDCSILDIVLMQDYWKTPAMTGQHMKKKIGMRVYLCRKNRNDA